MIHYPHRNIIAFDPGSSGGVAVYLADWQEVKLFNLPKDPASFQPIQALIEFHTRTPWQGFCEKVPSFVGKNIPGSSGFILGRSYGWCQMFCTAHEISLIELTPQKWQKIIEAGKRNKMSGAAWKRHLKGLAIQRNPEVKGITLSTCDALLILEAGILSIK